MAELLAANLPQQLLVPGLQQAFINNAPTSQLELLIMPTVSNEKVTLPTMDEQYFQIIKQNLTHCRMDLVYQMARGCENRGIPFQWLVSMAFLAEKVQLRPDYAKIPLEHLVQTINRIAPELLAGQPETFNITGLVRYVQLPNGTFFYPWEGTNVPDKWREDLFMPVLLKSGQTPEAYLEQFLRHIFQWGVPDSLESVVARLTNSEIRRNYERALLDDLVRDRLEGLSMEYSFENVIAILFPNSPAKVNDFIARDKNLTMSWNEFERMLNAQVFQLPVPAFQFEAHLLEVENFTFDTKTSLEMTPETIMAQYIKYVYDDGSHEWTEIQFMQALRDLQRQSEFSNFLDRQQEAPSNESNGKGMTITFAVLGVGALLLWIWINKNSATKLYV